MPDFQLLLNGEEYEIPELDDFDTVSTYAVELKASLVERMGAVRRYLHKERPFAASDLRSKYPSDSASESSSLAAYIVSFYLDYFIFCLGTDHYKVPYTFDENTLAVTITPMESWEKVQKMDSWIPAAEAKAAGMYIEVTEDDEFIDVPEADVKLTSFVQVKFSSDDDEAEFEGDYFEDDPDDIPDVEVKTDPETVPEVTSETVYAEQRLAIKTQRLTPCQFKEIKVVDPKTRRIALYTTVWGEKDCQNDRMTKSAIEPYLGKSQPLMLYLHGLDPRFGSNPVGVWDMPAFKADEYGLWSEGNIGMDVYGNMAWDEITKAKSVAGSVGSVWYLVKRQPSVKGGNDVTDWPPFEISIMGSEKQCVPSARTDMITPDFIKAVAPLAVKMGMSLENPIDETADGGNMSTANVEEIVAKMLADREAEAKAAAEAEAARKSEIEAKAAEIAEEKAAELAEEKAKTLVEAALGDVEAKHSKALEELKAEHARNLEQLQAQFRSHGRAAGPVTDFAGDPPAIKMRSHFDNHTTLELCLRHEVLRSYGRNPSNKFVHALEQRVKDMAREEDVVAVKMGQPVKVPAIDWAALTSEIGSADVSEASVENLFNAAAIKSDRMHKATFDVSGVAGDPVSPIGVQQFHFLAAKANELSYSTQASYGDDWVPTLMSATLWREIRLNAVVLPLFTQFDMPSQPYDWPTEGADPVFYKVSETTNEAQLILTGGPFTDSKVGTDKVTFSAGKLGGISYWSEEMDEDSIIAFSPQVQDQHGIVMAHTLDEILLSGDETTGTANISNDGGAIGATSRFLIMDGLRHAPLVTTTSDATAVATLDFQAFITARSLMGPAGRYGLNTANLTYLVDPAVYFKSLTLDEVITIDKMGSMATIINGQLASVGGVSLVVSQDFSLTDTAGKISSTGGNNTKGSFLCINRQGWRVGWKRRPRVRVVGLPGADARFIVSSARLDIQPMRAGMASLVYNITV